MKRFIMELSSASYSYRIRISLCRFIVTARITIHQSWNRKHLISVFPSNRCCTKASTPGKEMLNFLVESTVRTGIQTTEANDYLPNEEAIARVCFRRDDRSECLDRWMRPSLGRVKGLLKKRGRRKTQCLCRCHGFGGRLYSTLPSRCFLHTLESRHVVFLQLPKTTLHPAWLKNIGTPTVIPTVNQLTYRVFVWIT